MTSTTQTTRLSLFFGKVHDGVLIGRYCRNPTGGGWLLEESLVAAPFTQFAEDPRKLIGRVAAGDSDLPKKKEKVGKPFLARHDEVGVTLVEGGGMQLIPVLRESNGISGIQASNVPPVVSSAAGPVEVMSAIKSALDVISAK